MVKIVTSSPADPDRQLVVFGTDWCGHCAHALTDYCGVTEDQVATVKEQPRANLPNGPDNTAMCRDLGISGYPTVMAVDKAPEALSKANVKADKYMHEVPRSILLDQQK